MDFWVVDVKSTVNVNGNDVAFDYINTYFSLSEAIKEAKLLSENDDVLEVSVHKWIMKDDGSQEHADGDDAIPYRFLDKDHREWKWERDYGEKKDKIQWIWMWQSSLYSKGRDFRLMYSTEIYSSKKYYG